MVCIAGTANKQNHDTNMAKIVGTRTDHRDSAHSHMLYPHVNFSHLFQCGEHIGLCTAMPNVHSLPLHPATRPHGRPTVEQRKVLWPQLSTNRHAAG